MSNWGVSGRLGASGSGRIFQTTLSAKNMLKLLFAANHLMFVFIKNHVVIADHHANASIQSHLDVTSHLVGASHQNRHITASHLVSAYIHRAFITHIIAWLDVVRKKNTITLMHLTIVMCSIKAGRRSIPILVQGPLVVLSLNPVAFLFPPAVLSLHHVVLAFALGDLASTVLRTSHLAMVAIPFFLLVGNKKKIILTPGSLVVQVIALVSRRSQSALV
jgi:hypothetical protein